MITPARNSDSLSARNNLLNACHLRTAITLSLSAALLVASEFLSIKINLAAATMPLILLLTLNLFYYRLVSNPLPNQPNVLPLQLLIDITLLSISFYFSGGPSNPFISFYLVPLTISATLLKPAFTWIITGLTFIAYTCLLAYAPQPTQLVMQHAHHQANSQFNIHLVGMWLNFALSACLISYFIIRLNIEISNRDNAIETYKEKLTRGEQVLGLATLATGAAHEISTPLSTIAVTIGDLLQEPSNESTANELRIIDSQVKECKLILSQLTAEAGQDRADYQRPPKNITSYINHLINRLTILRPNNPAKLARTTPESALQVTPHPTIDQAILNLINNACDASPQFVEIFFKVSNATLEIRISDHGAGIDPIVLQHVGEPYNSSGKDEGLGLGLFLAHTTFDRFGGSLSLYNQKEGGTLTCINLPLLSITPQADLQNES